VPVTLTAVDLWLGLVGAPPAVAAAVSGAARALFGFVLPPTVGIWLLLAACVVYQRRRARASNRSLSVD
jgi:hypothetical protein